MYDKYFKPWQFLLGTHYFTHCEGFILETIDNNNINNKPEISVIFKNDFIHYSTCAIHMEKRKEGREEKRGWWCYRFDSDRPLHMTNVRLFTHAFSANVVTESASRQLKHSLTPHTKLRQSTSTELQKQNSEQKPTVKRTQFVSYFNLIYIFEIIRIY